MSADSIPYKVSFSARRKRFSIRISHDGVEVRAPLRASKRQIARILKQRKEWIETKLALVGDLPLVPQPEYLEGERFSYLGKRYRLSVRISHRTGMGLVAGRLVARVPEALTAKEQPLFIRDLLFDWYESRAQVVLEKKAREVAASINRQPTRVRIRRTKSQWGHCTPKGVLQFNWLIMQAPLAVINYLVAHEVCHLQHPNHSPDFWSLVEQLCPDFNKQRIWLKSQGYLLAI